MAELALGKHYKKGTLGSLGNLAGKKFNWMGTFITIVTLGIAFYYSVVTGWSLRYFILNTESLVGYLFGSGELNTKIGETDFMNNFWSGLSNSSWVASVMLYGYHSGCHLGVK